ncbi:MAG: hypothetical protein KJP09_04575 [Bacteroidia bacterium]|nr:hypothetical protein [Bacteroidia bacterium]NND10200.1 hypothetical protein [Flavobacteriaceae bacterium]NNK27682.1 hypothetical protein [Flavobacteriaceae bacterium]
MKKTFVFTLIVALIFLGCSNDDDSQRDSIDNNPQLTLIPDSSFEQALIDLGVDTELNGSVPTSSIANVTELVFNNRGISSMQGLEDFSSLINLWLNDNMLDQLNVSQNTNLKFIYAENNMLTSLSVNGLDDLEKIGMNGNNITSIDISGNPNLQQLEIIDNEVSSLDVSNNPALTRLYVSGNPLTCIKVSPDQLANTPLDWIIDMEDELSETCN